MTSRQTELRRAVKHIMSEVLQGELDVGSFTDLSWEASEFGFTEGQLRAEIIRQVGVMQAEAAR